MGRAPRPDRPGGWFHVVNRGVDHQPIFFDDSDRVDFGRLLGVGHDRFGVEVHAYCLMTNHFHLLVHCPSGGLSDFMHDVTATFTRHVNDRLGRDGPLVRGRFRSFIVDSDAYVLCATRYIHRNPLDIADVHDIEAYRWSSHRTYLGHRRRPAWLRTDHVMAQFDDDVARYDSFVRGDDPTPAVRSIGAVGFADASSLIDVLIDEQIGPASSEQTSIRRAVSMLAHATIAPSRRPPWLNGMVPVRDSAYRSALSRARRRADADPRIADIAGRIARLAA